MVREANVFTFCSSRRHHTCYFEIPTENSPDGIFDVSLNLPTKQLITPLFVSRRAVAVPLTMLYFKYSAVLVHDISETGGNFQNF